MYKDNISIGKFISDSSFDIFGTVQRKYSWQDDDKGYSRLIKDISRCIKENTSKHIGTIFLYSGSYDGKKPQNDKRLSLVDGQQRLISIMLMISSASKKFREGGDVERADICDSYLFDKHNDIKSKNILKISKLKLQSQYDAMFIDFINKDVKNIKKINYKNNRSIGMLYKANNIIDEYIQSKSLDELVIFIDFLLNHLMIDISISDNYQESVATYIRENSRGTRHSNDDIIITHFVTKYTTIDDQFKYRERIESTLVPNLMFDGKDNIATFIRYYLLSYNIKRTLNQIPDYIENELEAKTQMETTKYLDTLERYSNIYKSFMSGKDGNGTHNQSISNIRNVVNYSQPIVVLIAAFDKFSDDKKKFNEICRELERVSITYAITDTSHHDLDSKFPGIAKLIRECLNDGDYQKIIDSLRSIWMQEHSNVMLKLKNRGFKEFSETIKLFILSEISKSLGSNTPDSFTLEHIMPINIYKKNKDGNINKIGGWDHISDEEHDKYIGDIGNLSIMDGKVNSAIKNESFIEKQKRYKNSDSSRLSKSIAAKLETGTKNTSYDKAIKVFNYDPPVKWDVDEIIRRKNHIINLFDYVLYKT